MLKLEIKGEFENQIELEKYLTSVLDKVKASNQFNKSFHQFFGTDNLIPHKNVILAHVIKEE